MPFIPEVDLDSVQERVFFNFLQCESFWQSTFEDLLASDLEGPLFFEVWTRFPQITIFPTLF